MKKPTIMLTVRCSIIDGLFLMYAIDIFSIRVVWPFFKFGWKRKLKNAKGRHIVFWYDEEGDFLEDIDHLQLENVRIWKLTENNLFATKYELEKKDQTSHFLIYANMARPMPKEDWLLDIYKYSVEFTTDKMIVTMRDFGITDDTLHPVFKKNEKFFKNKERYAAFQDYHIQDYNEETVEIAILSALCRCSVPNLDEVIKILFKEMNQESSKSWKEIQKFGDEAAFWLLVEKYYNYTLEEHTIQSLFTFFTLTNMFATLQVDIPPNWGKYISNYKANCVIFMNQYMNNSGSRKDYNVAANSFEQILKIDDLIEHWEISDYKGTDTFSIFDQKIIEFITSQLLNDIQQYDIYLDLIDERRKLHWYPEFVHEYESLKYAIQLLKKVLELDNFICQQSSFEMVQIYVREYYVIDTAYRKFYTAFDQVSNRNHLLPLKEKVENIYTNWYMDELSMKWAGAIDGEQNEYWPISGIHQEMEFYETTIRPYIQKEEHVFVIISDALRYEAAKELSDLLNRCRKGSTDITFMQSTLPSYTDLGMASLLPHSQIAYEKDAVFVDGIRATGTENRNTILQKNVQDSLAIQYKKLMDMNRQQLRNTISGKKLVYIYHNSIDAVGDHGATESNVFQAVEDTIGEIFSLVEHLLKNVSITNIIITADHGFIYHRNQLQESDKVVKKLDDSMIANRRFIISEEKLQLEGTMTFSMDYLLRNQELYVTVPRGSNRFAIQGAGANYVHGGTMLQEIIIPVIKFKNDRSKSKKNEVSKVEVKLTSITRKITNMITYLDFFQTQKVEEKKSPLRLKLYFTDEEGNHISNENIMIADCSSLNAEARTFKERFIFKNMKYDKSARYYLLMEDEEESVEYDKIPFMIDITFSNKYGF